MVRKYQLILHEIIKIVVCIAIYMLISALLLWVGNHLREVSFIYSRIIGLIAMLLSILLWVSSGVLLRKEYSLHKEAKLNSNIILIFMIILISLVINGNSIEFTDSYFKRLWTFPFIWVSVFFKDQYVMLTTDFFIIFLSVLGYYVTGLVKYKKD